MVTCGVARNSLSGLKCSWLPAVTSLPPLLLTALGFKPRLPWDLFLLTANRITVKAGTY